MRLTLSPLPLLAVLVLLAVGCRGNSTVSGKIVMNGQPYTIAGREAFGLSFEPLNSAGPTYWARVNKDGSFRLTKSLPTGTYRVGITHRGDYAPVMQKSPGRGMGWTGGAPDRFGGAFLGPQSPLRVELNGGVTRLTIDLGQRTVTRG
jgi:hypothetical protein